MAYINLFIKSMVDETTATAQSSERRRRFVNRWRRVQLVKLPNSPIVQASAAAAPAATAETLDANEPRAFWRVLAALRMALANRSLLMDKLHGFSAVKFVVQAEPMGTEDGYGRNDAFGVGRNELFGAYKDANFTQGLNVMPADAPVSFPHLWGMDRTSWFQWGVNTNSVIERNIGQALGVGATMQPDQGFRSTVRLENLHAMEKLQYKLASPVWPAELFGAVDPVRAERGKKVFDRTCALCHETYGKTGRLNEYQLFSLDVVGTDPSTAINFERSVMTAEGPKPFGIAAFEIVKKVKAAYYQEYNTPPDVQALWESRATRPKAEFRVPLREYQKFPDTRHRGVYRSKTLKGIWATAPFLHNGSVPSLYDLLLPAEQRPTTFRLGTKEYDPVKLGYVVDGPRFLTPPGMKPFALDTRLLGNWNTGHEWWFYPDLDDEMRYDIIEFLKTFDDVNYPGDYRFERPAMLPDNVRMRKPLPDAVKSYSHAFNRQDWQQGELEVVQPLTFPERNLEGIVGFGDLRHGLEGHPVHLLEQRSTDPHMRCDHPQDVSAPLQGHLRRVQAAVGLKNSSEPIQNTVLFINGSMVVVGVIEQWLPCALAVPCLQHRVLSREIVDAILHVANRCAQIPVAIGVIEDPVEHVNRVDDRRSIERPAAHFAQRVGQLLLVMLSPLFRVLLQADLQSDSRYRIFGILWKDGGQNGLIITGSGRTACAMSCHAEMLIRAESFVICQRKPAGSCVSRRES